MGLTTSLGTGVEAAWECLLEGRTGISRHERGGLPEYLRWFGEAEGMERIEGVPKALAGQVRFLNRGSHLGFLAAREAVESSRIDLSSIARQKRGLFIASGDLTKVGCEFIYPALKDGAKGNGGGINFAAMNRSTVGKVNPFFLLESISNNLFSFLSAVYEFMGPNTSMASLSPCGGHALELACRRIRSGDADVALAVGCGNWITEIPMYEMDGLGILSRCAKGSASFRPLDRARDGFIPGEGGAAVLLEEAGEAEKRGATVLAEIRGLGNCFEFPSGKGLSVPARVSKRSMELALEEAGLEAGELAAVFPHGSGTRKGDRSELRSIGEVLGNRRGDVPLCALKPYTGHMGAASDISEVIFGIRAMSEGIVPGTLNFARAEPDFEDLAISASTRKTSGKTFLAVSYGIMGQCSCVVVEHCASRP